MNPSDNTGPHHAVLVLPRIRVQNANAISSPMTWGFPAITAFTGAMTALERRLGPDTGMALMGVGVVCHGFEAQVSTAGYTRAFHLTRNPVLQDGSTAGIVEEGRVHLDLTLVFKVTLTTQRLGGAERAALAQRAADVLAGMRVAGGSVMPRLGRTHRGATPPQLLLVPDGDEPGATDAQRKNYVEWFRRLRRSWLPGFALVSRDDLLHARLAELQQEEPDTTVLDAWLDLARWNARAVPPAPDADADAPVAWATDSRPGWTVPIPVGFAALSPLLPAGSVAGARDMRIPFRFVETVWSIGQWLSPHRLQGLDDLIWAPDHDEDAESGLYRCVNLYKAAPATTPGDALADATAR